MGLTDSAYARHRAGRGLAGNRRAVQKARAAGRIPILADGTIDAAAADAAWLRNTSESHRRNPAQERRPAAATVVAPAAATLRAVPTLPPAPADDAGVPLDLCLAVEQAREKYWKANQAELDYREQCGTLTDAKEIGDRLIGIFTNCRNRLLGLPTRAKQQLPHLSLTDIAALDGIVREACEALALELESEGSQAVASG